MKTTCDIACTPSAAAALCERLEVMAILAETTAAIVVRVCLSPAQLAYARRAVAGLPGAKLFERGEPLVAGPALDEAEEFVILPGE